MLKSPYSTGAKNQRNGLLAIICISYFMVILDNSIIFTGLPQIERSMGFSAASLAWVTDAYVLMFGGFLLLGARAGDLLGRRLVFIIGLAIFGIASALVGIAPTNWWLVGARAIQGLGAAILAPSSLALLTEHFEEGRERSRAVAAYSAMAGIGASAGLVIGGFLADVLSWRAGFFLNVPIGIVMITAALKVVRASPRKSGRFDLVGALSGTLGMTALVFGVIYAAETTWINGVTLTSLLIGLVLVGLFIVNEAKAEQPIMPLSLFRSRERVGAYSARFLYLAAMMGFFFFTTQYLQGILGFTPLLAGLGFLPMSAINFVVAIMVESIIQRFGPNRVLIVGVAMTFLGMVWLSRVGMTSNYWLSIALPMALIGIGQGLAFAPMTSAGLRGVTGPNAGAASGVINTFHQLGSALGIGILVAVGAASTPAELSNQEALLAQVNAALVGSSVLLVAALAVVAATRPDRSHMKPT